MKIRSLQRALPAVMIALCCSLSVADVELPEARSLVDAHLEASGGMEALKHQLDSTTHGRFLMPAAGMEGQMTLYSRSPNERVALIELEGIGNIHSGYNDGQAWSVDPFMGPRLITDTELDIQIESNELEAQLRSEKFVESMQTVATAEYNGESCYKVNVVWKSGRESTDCYSADTGLLLASTFTVESPMGEMETVTVFDEYKAFESNGVEVLLPVTTSVTTMGQQQQLIIDSIELGEPADEYFELPPAIVTLMEPSAEEAATPE